MRKQSRGDPAFAEDLARSHPYVAAIAHLHEMAGRTCGEYPMRETAGRPHDQHDIAVFQPEEIKSRDFTFSDLHEFASGGGQRDPGTYCLAILDTCHHIEGNLKRFASLAECYWLWSKDRGHVIRIDVRKTMRHWVRQWLYSRNRYRAHYMCPLFQSAGQPVMTARQYLNRVLQPLDGVRCWSFEDLRERSIKRRSEMWRILSDLKRSRWYDGETLLQDNPGIPKP